MCPQLLPGSAEPFEVPQSLGVAQAGPGVGDKDVVNALKLGFGQSSP
jgi:hypothetical protein